MSQIMGCTNTIASLCLTCISLSFESYLQVDSSLPVKVARSLVKSVATNTTSYGLDPLQVLQVQLSLCAHYMCQKLGAISVSSA